MATFFRKFKIDSTIEFPSDHFTLEFTGSEPFRNKTATDTVNLRIGLLDGVTPENITAIEGGITDEFEIILGPDAITGTKNGRDGIANAIDGMFEKRYYRFPEVVPEYPPRDPVTHQPIPQVDSTDTPLPDPPPGISGIFMASQIAREAGDAVGVPVIWGCPDYELQGNFFATGRVIDTINKLVQPYTLLAPFKADIYSDGQTLLIRSRNPLAAPTYSISMANAKRVSATMRVRKTQEYGQVWLTGASDPLAQNSSGVWIEGEETTETTDEPKNANGQILARTITRETKITPTGQTKRKIVDYYVPAGGAGGALKYSHRTTEENEYTIGTFGIAGPIQPKVLISTTTKKEGFNRNGIWVTQETYERGLSYDHGIATGKQTSEVELTKKLVTVNGVATLQPSSSKVKTTKDSGYLLVEHVTTQFKYTRDRNGIYQPVFAGQDVQRQAGFRAGGPSALPRRTGSQRGDQLQLVRTISIQPKAVKVVQSLPNFDLDMLKEVMRQFEFTSGIWEYEVLLVGVNMPWIKRGMYLQLTDVQSEIVGTNIDLPTMLVTEVVSEYDESTLQPKSTCSIRCFGWRQS